jgi:hypothetical protein
MVTLNRPTLDSRVRVHDGVVFQASHDEAVLLDVNSGVYFGLDPVGARIWELFGVHELLSEIARRVQEEYEVSEHQCASDLLTLVAELEAHGLVTVSSDARRRLFDRNPPAL